MSLRFLVGIRQSRSWTRRQRSGARAGSRTHRARRPAGRTAPFFLLLSVLAASKNRRRDFGAKERGPRFGECPRDIEVEVDTQARHIAQLHMAIADDWVAGAPHH